MEQALKLLLVEDSEDDALLIVHELKHGGYNDLIFKRVDTAEAMSKELDNNTWDIIIADYSLPHFSGLGAIKLLKEKELDIPFILVSGTVGEEVAVKAIKAGANDYLLKNHLTRLIPAIQRELRDAQLRLLQKQSEEKLLELASIVESSDDAIISKTLDGTITSWNKGAEKIFGYAANEAIGKLLNILIPTELDNEETKIIEEIKNGKHIEQYETKRQRKSGETIYVSVTASPVRDQKGRINGVSIVSRDITKHKRAEEKFRLAVEAAPNGMVMVDKSGKITLVNKQMEKLFGYSKEELMGKTIELLIPDRFKSKHPEYRNSFFNDPQMRLMGVGRDLFGVRKDGTEFPVEIGLNPIRTEEGIFVLASIIDITERKNSEKMLKQKTLELEYSNEQLARSNQELEQFAYVASHDLQEPIRMVSIYTKLLAEKYKDKIDEKANKYIDFAVNGAFIMQELINGLLNYSRIGNKLSEAVQVDCKKLVEQIINNINKIKEINATVNYHDLPTVIYDKTQLMQVFQNLISNAVKYHKIDEPLKIDINAKAEKNYWLFSVKDTGIGFDKESSERIFELFQRLHTRKQYEGTGMGLTICKKIIEKNSGSIWAESEPQKGSTFYFTIPKQEVL